MKYLNSISSSNKLTLDMIFVVLYKQSNSAADNIIDAGHTVSTDYNY